MAHPVRHQALTSLQVLGSDGIRSLPPELRRSPGWGHRVWPLFRAPSTLQAHALVPTLLKERVMCTVLHQAFTGSQPTHNLREKHVQNRRKMVSLQVITRSLVKLFTSLFDLLGSLEAWNEPCSLDEGTPAVGVSKLTGAKPEFGLQPTLQKCRNVCQSPAQSPDQAGSCYVQSCACADLHRSSLCRCPRTAKQQKMALA